MDIDTLSGQELRDKILLGLKYTRVTPSSNGSVCLWARYSC